jgi:hypothetical protein
VIGSPVDSRRASSKEEKMKEKYTYEEIARLAYELWERRGRPLGSPEIDWYAAESALACGIRERSSRSRVSALRQKNVPIANPEFSVVV